MKITGWTWYDNPEYKDMFPPGEQRLLPHSYDYIKQLIASELREHGYKFSGQYHQYGDFGAPIIDNEWIFQVSQRSWGHIMVLAYPDEIDNADGYGYCEWAWMAPMDMVLPNEEHYRETK